MFIENKVTSNADNFLPKSTTSNVHQSISLNERKFTFKYSIYWKHLHFNILGKKLSNPQLKRRDRQHV